ncbi:MAG TPA: ABC transporter permease subunit [Cyclobacteriaceae bacterium]|nr:ABC transporter permease subunit [Cyclobacteriaceae bacterium]
MSAVLVIAKRELNSFFDSLMAYILLALFLGFTGLFTWLLGGSDVFYIGQATLAQFFSYANLSFFVFIPALTMQLLAEERKIGTLELLLTKSVTDRQVVYGKFLAAVSMLAIALLFTLPFVVTIFSIGDADVGQIVSGYFGLLLTGAAFVSIGLYASSLTSNQIVSFLVALIISVFFQFIFNILASSIPGVVGEVLSDLSITTHFESISRGVLDTRDLIYFISVIFLGLFLSELSLTKRNQ